LSGDGKTGRGVKRNDLYKRVGRRESNCGTFEWAVSKGKGAGEGKK